MTWTQQKQTSGSRFLPHRRQYIVTSKLLMIWHCVHIGGILQRGFLGALNVCHVKKWELLFLQVYLHQPVQPHWSHPWKWHATNTKTQAQLNFHVSSRSRGTANEQIQSCHVCANVSSQPGFNQRNCLHTLQAVALVRKSMSTVVLCGRCFVYIHHKSVKSQQAVISCAIAVTGVTNQRDLHLTVPRVKMLLSF